MLLVVAVLSVCASGFMCVRLRAEEGTLVVAIPHLSFGSLRWFVRGMTLGAT